MSTETLKAGSKSSAEVISEARPGGLDPSRPLVLFDGVCNLCDGFVQFVLKHEQDNELMFTSLQGEAGSYVIAHHQLPAGFDKSILVYEGGKLYQKSQAVFRIIRHLRNPYKAFGVLKIVPGFIRNFVYDMVAKNRYGMFGKKDECMIPTPELKARFYN